MSLGRALLDTAVFVYAVGSDHPYREPCRRLLDPDAAVGLSAEASVQAIQELLHQRARRTGDRTEAVQTAEAMASLCQLHDLTTDDLRLGLRLFRSAPRLHGRDALHAATALNRSIGVIISPDRAFDDLPGLIRLDPVAAAARL
jgi:predicted nucleic acid-binding protein